jgi:U3 small nucleolar RNA-associated protein 10
MQAIMEYLDILGLAIDKHSKSEVAKNVGSLSAIFLATFDLRRIEHERTEKTNSTRNLTRIEEAVNAVALRMIYKLNDAAFRPIFSQLMEWAVALPKSDPTGRNLRLLGVFGFLFVFFDSLKSIVTGYASYVIDVAVAALKATSPHDAEARDLWRKVLQTLAKCFEHDQDDFWQAPAHFSAVAPALTEQLLHAAKGGNADVTTHDVVPALVELAAAADSQDHHKELNSALLKHLRSEHAGVRRAAVRAEQHLTERLGEDWLAMLPEMLPYISELQEDDDEDVERETQRWIVGIEGILGENLDAMLQ